MKALITGASSGLGADMARVLVEEGYEVILVARRKGKLEKLAKELGDNAKIIVKDISSTYNCVELYNEVKNEDIDILINNAGFGLCGFFNETNLDKELDMIDLNIKSLHTLTKLFLKDFVKKDQGYILNVGSSAGFMPGPLMTTYYSTKNYVVSFTSALYEELRRLGSNVSISCLCPGPVDTEFNKVARVKFAVKAMESNKVARYAIKKMFDEKLIIVPGFGMKAALFFSKFMSRKSLLKMTYKIQEKKTK
ncbi:MAG: SDR family oxidoreductase [Bacilli bacterium]|nr:SDR family oxidoreductase [Bacilli bacterium]